MKMIHCSDFAVKDLVYPGQGGTLKHLTMHGNSERRMSGSLMLSGATIIFCLVTESTGFQITGEI